MKWVESNLVDLLIIGIGNPLRGDDAAGVRAAEMLSTHVHDRQMRVITTHQLLPEHAEEIAKARRVLFLDASVDVASGRLKCHRITAAAGEQPLSHHVTPEALLLLAQKLYDASPDCWLIEIGGQSFDPRARLSRIMQHPIRRLVEELSSQIRLWRSQDA